MENWNKIQKAFDALKKVFDESGLNAAQQNKLYLLEMTKNIAAQSLSPEKYENLESYLEGLQRHISDN